MKAAASMSDRTRVIDWLAGAQADLPPAGDVSFGRQGGCLRRINDLAGFQAGSVQKLNSPRSILKLGCEYARRSREQLGYAGGVFSARLREVRPPAARPPD